MHTFTFEAIGTHWQVDLYSSLSPTQLEHLQRTLYKRIDDFDNVYSRFRENSFVSKTLSQVGTYTLPSDAEPLLNLYQKLYKVTNGLFTPLIGKVLIDAGYDADYSLKKKILHVPSPLEDVMEYSHPNITMKKKEILDFGACGKGYLIDIVSSIIRSSDVSSFCVDAGGDIRYERAEPLRIGLENPNNTDQAIGVATISQTSLCASAGSRRKWGEYHHIINPHTLSSPHTITASWVIAKDTITADAIATCLFLVPPKQLLPHFTFEYLILLPNNTFEKSSGFPAELFLE